MPRALITGITGQDGSYLAEFLLAKGYEVHGLVRHTSRQDRIRHLRLFLHYGDLCDGAGLERILASVRPDEIYNLGAQTQVRLSITQPEPTCDAAGMGALRLLDAMIKANVRARFYQASTSEMFGKAVEAPQSEETPFHPRSPYGVAKLFSYWMTVNYRDNHRLHASNGIMFNHESPRRGHEFVTRKIAAAVARIKAGQQQKLILGDLDARRDWGYAPEYVEAMWLMLQQDEPDDYVIATGESHSVREFVEIAFHRADLDWRKYVEIDQTLCRPAEAKPLVGNSRKARLILGWRPRTTFGQLVHSLVDAELAAVGQQRNRPELKISGVAVDTILRASIISNA
jgi:GDPmannose 4,6-dehydratase